MVAKFRAQNNSQGLEKSLESVNFVLWLSTLWDYFNKNLILLEIVDELCCDMKGIRCLPEVSFQNTGSMSVLIPL